MNPPEETISALLPVHAGVDERHLEEALASLLAQTRRADEVVIVEDGPLREAHRAALDRFEKAHAGVARVRLPTNQGAGVANQVGLEVAKETWIAKADADDISMPHRFEAQLRALDSHHADVCGSAMVEFVGDPEHALAIRTNPPMHAQIARRMRFNNPINHPTAMYRRDLAIASGGYGDLRLMQDYVLFARMYRNGALMVNLDEPLVYFRAGAGLHARRAGRGFARLEWEVQRELSALGLIGRGRALVNYMFRMGYRSSPDALRRWVHNHVLARLLPREPTS